MLGKQAKILTDEDVKHVLRLVRKTRHPDRNRVMVLLSVKAGLRACEIAGLSWPMVLDARGAIAPVLAIRNGISKRGRGREVPVNSELRSALSQLHKRSQESDADQPVIRSERGQAICADAVVNWFGRLYRRAGLVGCSSHSGRRTFITKAARMVHRAGGSLRDVQQMAGHASIDMTQRYIEGDTAAKRALVNLI
jgi:integrase